MRDDPADFFMADQTPEPPPPPSTPEPVSEPAPEPDRARNNSTQKESARSKTAPTLTLDTSLPANIDAEKTILGAILLDNAALKEVNNLSIEADDFFLDSHKRIALRMKEIYESKGAIDIVTLAHALARHKEVEAVGGIAYLASLTEGLPRRPVINEYLRIVKDKSIARQIILISSAAMARAADQSEDAIGTLDFLQTNLAGVRDRCRALMTNKNTEPFFVGYQTFVAEAAPEIDWAIEGIIQREGSGLVIGDSGAAKSLLVFDIAVHMVAGVSWFQHRIPNRMKVGLVAREDAPGLSQNRLRKMVDGASESVRMFIEHIDLEKHLYINTRTQRETWTLQSEADLLDIIQAIREREIDFVFFDVFRSLWEGNENDNQETAKVLAAAKRIEREGKCQVGLVHHLSKSDKGTIFDRARGGGINGWKEWGIGVTIENPDVEPKNQLRKLYFHTKADCASPPIHYRIDGDDKYLRLEQVDAPAQQYSYNSVKKKKKDGPEQQQMPYNEDSND